MFFQRIEYGVFSAEQNMKIDSENLQSAENSGESVFRTYGWDRKSVTVGHFQKIEKIIDIELCEKYDIPIVRRPTGGKALLHCGDFTFSVVFGKKIQGCNIRDYYKIVNTALNSALNDIGVSSAIKAEQAKNEINNPLCFNYISQYELVYGAVKIAGTAQRCLKNAVLVQGTLPLKTDYELYDKIFKINEKKIILKNDRVIIDEELVIPHVLSERFFRQLSDII